MRDWLKYLGFAAAFLAIAVVYRMLFGPLLGVAFAATALVGALGCVAGLERLGIRSGKTMRAGLRSSLSVSHFLSHSLIQWTHALIAGGVWNWHSAECEHD